MTSIIMQSPSSTSPTSTCSSHALYSMWMESLYKSKTKMSIRTNKHDDSSNSSSRSNSNKKKKRPEQVVLSDEVLTKVAIQRVQDFESSWDLFQKSPHDIVPELDWKDVQVGKLLGKGTFAAVHQVVVLQKDAPATYAIKFLNKETSNNPNNFLAGAVDLAMEARILACLSHENIIKVHGVKAGSFEESLEKKDNFIILDLLDQTLEHLLKREQLQQELDLAEQSTIWKWVHLWRHRPQHHDAALYNRLQTIAVGIARGMEYLHSHNIVFRDLKPSNVGFDAVSGQVKIFDFGLARQICGGGKLAGGTQVGSPRYMAPEVAKCEPYGVSADVYSFGILLWELCTLRKPYQEFHTQELLLEHVVFQEERPPLNQHVCFFTRHSKLKIMLQGCWHVQPTCRPSFSTILTELSWELSTTKSPAPIAQQQQHVKRRRLFPSMGSFRKQQQQQQQSERNFFWRRAVEECHSHSHQQCCHESHGDDEEEETVVFER